MGMVFVLCVVCLGFGVGEGRGEGEVVGWGMGKKKFLREEF